ncbi:conserved hypothetical protein [uncultured Desulfobacterium sp.]|uniref:GxxExxY protein n=1 Tax=uncultured Desulfobacterium sp. TaxID=201089 RepID=A0A445MUJ9_9BACT|nr:conserved hypothetical protein [uncultured Desulfobacterium sp.]
MNKDERTFRIIGAAMEVHRELGCGFLEGVYQEALGLEFENKAVPFIEQPVIEVMYKGAPLNKRYQPDFLCFEDVVVEIKAISNLGTNEQAQVINYLKATKLSVGLLINFGSKSMEYKRIVYSNL